jgi:hypothetical protein
VCVSDLTVKHDERRRETMIAPGSIADWTLLAGLLGSLSALAIVTHRWVLQESAEPQRVRSHPDIAPAGLPDRVST